MLLFDDIIKIEDFNLYNVSIDEKSYKDTLVYAILYKTLIDAKPVHIRFDKIDRFIRVYYGTRYLMLFGSKRYDFIYNRVRYLLSVKSSIRYVISHSYAKIKVDTYDSLPLEKTMTFHNVIILIKLVLNKDKNNYYYSIFLEKACYEFEKNKFINKEEGIHTNKTSASKECYIFHYWYFLNKGFKFQSYVCNRLHDLVMMSMNLNDIATQMLKVLFTAVLLAELAKMRR